MSADSLPPLLIVEDDLALQKQIKWSLDKFESVTASDRESALVAFRRHRPAVVTMDLGLPPDADGTSEGFRLLGQLLELDGDVKVIVLTGQNDRANALRAVAMGAYDFFAKPFEPELLALTIERAYRLWELQSENRRLQAMQPSGTLAGLITRDPEMLRICRMIERVAAATPPSCCWARAAPARKCWRRACTRPAKRSGKFVAINCAAIPEALLESELFGYEKGRVHRRRQDHGRQDRDRATAAR
jgi:two-component system NtrC family response regulator